jgi:hypothetical protein
MNVKNMRAAQGYLRPRRGSSPKSPKSSPKSPSPWTRRYQRVKGAQRYLRSGSIS